MVEFARIKFINIYENTLNKQAKGALTYFMFPSEFSGQEIHSTVVFNPVTQSAAALGEEEDAELKGPVVRRNCPMLMFDICISTVVNWDAFWPLLSRLIGGALVATKKGWFTTPDRCVLQTKDRQSSSPACTAGNIHEYALCCDLLSFFFFCTVTHLKYFCVTGIKKKKTLEDMLNFPPCYFFLMFIRMPSVAEEDIFST